MLLGDGARPEILAECQAWHMQRLSGENLKQDGVQDGVGLTCMMRGSYMTVACSCAC